MLSPGILLCGVQIGPLGPISVQCVIKRGQAAKFMTTKIGQNVSETEEVMLLIAAREGKFLPL